MSAITPQQTRQALGLVRTGLGVMSWIAPGLLVRVFGAHVRDHPPTPVLTRTFAAREIAMGVELLTAGPGEQRNRALDAGMAVDAADALALIVAGIRRQIPRPIAALGALGAVGALVVASVVRED